MRRRRAGILLHVTSLPGGFGAGDFGTGAEEFLRWAASAGQTLWQTLPLGPIAAGNSPYSLASAFAGNPSLISPEKLVEEGLLRESRISALPDRDGSAAKELLRDAWEALGIRGSSALKSGFESFRSSPERRGWLPTWALFAALKEHFGGAAWFSWPKELAAKTPGSIEDARRELAREIDFHEFVQFLFFRQWSAVKSLANGLAIDVIGDIPIYLSHDSADVWKHRRLFSLDAQGVPETLSGVPPDEYSADGQLWGQPVYRWDEMEKDDFRWWVSRLRASLETFDSVRLDHFRGFAAFWGVPAGKKTAASGRWIPGPGMKIFDAIRRELPHADLIAEDLGTITPDVEDLLARTGFPGMKVLQFAFGGPDSPHLPHHHRPNSFVYTGTHDNDTALGWYASLDERGRARVRSYLSSDGANIADDLVRAALASAADRAVIPLQDILNLGPAARMNTPGVIGNNWQWRCPQNALTPELAQRLRDWTHSAQRIAQPA